MKTTALLATFLIAGTSLAQGTYELRGITTEAALKAAQAALASCRSSGFAVAVAITDRAGVPIVVVRDRFAGPHTPETAANKAWTAASFRVDTLELARQTQPGQPSSGIRQLPRVVAVGGGRMVEAAGALLGGIGVSGAPGGEMDDGCARAGLHAIAADLEF